MREETNNLKLVMITGLSGAGKSQALHILEDLGFFCVDNLPPKLIPTLLELCLSTDGKITNIALVTDIRSEEFLVNFREAYDEIKNLNISYLLLFLEAEDEVIIRRYNETRRRHPLAKEGGSILESINLERQRLSEIRNLATHIIDTTNLTPKDLKGEMLKFLDSCLVNVKSNLIITVYSFGFKYGIPVDAHLIFDVRFLPNPYYDSELKLFSGESEKVREFVLKRKETKKFLDYLEGFLDFLIPLYQEEGKSHLNIAIGCTGGRHRAVVIAKEIADYLSSRYIVKVFHRDIYKDVS
ncbi:MAG TPA: RNase adapter RapZ [Dictyoglomaceae bacterium]|nr:RNase adapter RapZ [Dictyoglomaceae bacterium]HOL38690.1 RNase adapter RapZ [Dictyoglomaceae bacterium]HPP15561.1 RNase adapter RapZ [Dictyoglomaceae bacterium]